MDNRVEAAVRGAVCGATLGMPHVGRAAYRRLTFYDPVPTQMAASPVLDAWLVALWHLAQGRKAASLGETYAERWLTAQPAASVAKSNVARGLTAPATGAFANWFSLDAGALGRSALWGLVFPGDPRSAHHWAWWDASFDHSGDAAVLPAALASAISVLAAGGSFGESITGMTAYLTPESAGHKVVQHVLATPGLAVRAAFESAQKEFANGDGGRIEPGFAALVAALAGANDAATLMSEVVSCGGRTDQTGVAAGVLAGLKFGSIPDEWTSVTGELFVAGLTHRSLEPPDTVAELASRVSSLVRPHEPDAPQEPMLGPVEGLSVTKETEDLAIVATFPDGPLVSREGSLNLAVAIHNLEPVERDFEPKVSAEGAVVASRTPRVKVAPGQRAVFPVIIKDTQPGAEVLVKCKRSNLHVPVLAPETWLAAGPFEAETANPFVTVYPPERGQRATDAFSGRSGLSVRWEEWATSARAIDSEPLFKSGPGVVYLWSKVRFAKPGKVRIVAAASPGVVVWVDGVVTVKYKDTHVPVPKFEAPYMGEFSTLGETTLLIKLFRDRTPVAPLSLLFLDANGSVIEPVERLSLAE